MIRLLGMLLLLVSGAAGCTFHSNQMSTLKELFSPAAKPVYAWAVRYGQLEVPVMAVKQAPFLVFANSSGDAVSFDGWRIKAFTGLGLNAPVKLAYENHDPLFGDKVVSERVKCSDWELIGLAGTERHWVQTCEGQFVYQNTIRLDSAGNIININQVVDASGTRLVIYKR